MVSADYSNHFGASVGYNVYANKLSLYVVSYNSDRTQTALSAFDVSGNAYFLLPESTKVEAGEYGAFFTLPVVENTQPYTVLGFLVRDSGLKIKYGVVV